MTQIYYHYHHTIKPLKDLLPLHLKQPPTNTAAYQYSYYPRTIKIIVQYSLKYLIITIDFNDRYW